MSKAQYWKLTNEERQKFMDALTRVLAPLRAKVGISQGKLAEMVGLTRQTISMIESGKRPMSWSTYLSLILLFDYNEATHQMLRNVCAFPGELVERFNSGKAFESIPANPTFDIHAGETVRMIGALDENGRHSLHAVLQVEYARCIGKPITGEAVSDE